MRAAGGAGLDRAQAESGCAVAGQPDRPAAGSARSWPLAAAGLAKVALPPGEPTVALAESLFREASDLRQKDFAGSAQRYLQAARIQLDALRSGPAAGRASTT